MPFYTVAPLKIVLAWDSRPECLDPECEAEACIVEKSFSTALPAIGYCSFLALALLGWKRNRNQRAWTTLVSLCILLTGWFFLNDPLFNLVGNYIHIGTLDKHYGDLFVRMQIMALALLILYRPTLSRFKNRWAAYGAAWAGLMTFSLTCTISMMGFKHWNNLLQATFVWSLWSMALLGSYALASFLCRKKYSSFRFKILLAVFLLLANFAVFFLFEGIDTVLTGKGFEYLVKRMHKLLMVSMVAGTFVGSLTCIFLLVYSGPVAAMRKLRTQS